MSQVPRWTRNICALFSNPLQLVPRCSMTPEEYENTIARLLFIASGLLYWKFPMGKYWIYAAAVLGFMFLAGQTVEKFSSKDKQALEAKGALLGDPKQAPPQVVIPAIQESINDRMESFSQHLSDMNAKMAPMVSDALYDRRQTAEQMVTNVREMDSVRGIIIPSEDEQIYGSRPSVRSPKDRHQTMFQDDETNSVMKYISNVV